jgi:hypothetical protein
MSKPQLSAALLILAILAAATGLATLLPHGVTPNDLGYASLCPFAPWSSLLLLLLGGAAWVVRSYVLARLG